MSSTQRYVLQTVTEERSQLWDSFVDNHPAGHLLQSWKWGELKSSPSWHPLRVALWDEQQNQLVATAQILQRTAPRVPLQLGHLAYIPKGPLLDWSQPALCEAFFSQLDALLRKQGALALLLEPDQEAGTPEGDLVAKRLALLPAQPGRAVQPLRTIVLDLTPDEDTLLANMKEKWRYNVRLSRRKGVTIRVAESLEDVATWYTMLQLTGERDKFGIHTLAYYQRCWELFAPTQKMRLFLAEHDGQLLAGIFVGLCARQAIYLYGASSNEKRNLMPNYLLQWEAICWARQQGAELYDFWGIPDSDDEDEAMAGVYRFKSGWGGRVVRFLGGYEHIYRPLAMKLARRFVNAL